jgi:hypothetical protein
MNYRGIFSLSLSILLIFTSCRKTIETPIGKTFGSGLTVINDSFNGKDIVVVGNEGIQILVAFERRLEDGTLLEMAKTSFLSMPAICEDQEGNNWDLYGVCVLGPRLGDKLPLVHASQGFYFAFNSIYHGVEIYNGSIVNPSIPVLEPNEWLIDEEFVFATGGFDGIPAVEEAHFELFRSKDFIDVPFHVADDDRITVVKLGETIRAYPHNILTRHEVINDVIDGVPISVNYCPLTATGYTWIRNSNSYGVSGLLYNNNLLMYDRDTESLWSQMLGQAVWGNQQGNESVQLRTFETTFEMFKNMYDFQVDVMTLETGFPFSYEGNPYIEYNAIDNFLLFPTTYNDTRLLNKARVMGVIVDGECKVYPISEFN